MASHLLSLFFRARQPLPQTEHLTGTSVRRRMPAAKSETAAYSAGRWAVSLNPKVEDARASTFVVPVYLNQTDSRRVGLDDLRPHFHLPLKEAAEKLDLTLTVMKRTVRSLGYGKWPYRLLASVQHCLDQVELELGAWTSTPVARSTAFQQLSQIRACFQRNLDTFNGSMTSQQITGHSPTRLCSTDIAFSDFFGNASLIESSATRFGMPPSFKLRLDAPNVLCAGPDPQLNQRRDDLCPAIGPLSVSSRVVKVPRRKTQRLVSSTNNGRADASSLSQRLTGRAFGSRRPRQMTRAVDSPAQPSDGDWIANPDPADLVSSALIDSPLVGETPPRVLTRPLLRPSVPSRQPSMPSRRTSEDAPTYRERMVSRLGASLTPLASARLRPPPTGPMGVLRPSAVAPEAIQTDNQARLHPWPRATGMAADTYARAALPYNHGPDNTAATAVGRGPNDLSCFGAAPTPGGIFPTLLTPLDNSGTPSGRAAAGVLPRTAAPGLVLLSSSSPRPTPR